MIRLLDDTVIHCPPKLKALAKSNKEPTTKERKLLERMLKKDFFLSLIELACRDGNYRCIKCLAKTGRLV